MDITLYGTNTNTIRSKTSNDILDNDLENRLFFTLLNKNINKCNPIDNNNIDNCINYYSKIIPSINSQIINEYTNANLYNISNPVNAVYTDFTPIDNTKCTPITGTNRTQIQTASYNFPIINIHNPNITDNFTTSDIQSIKKLINGQSSKFTNIKTQEIITFTRINDSYPEKYILSKIRLCPDILNKFIVPI